MILKKLEIPIQAIQCIALLWRLPTHHFLRSIIEKDLKSWLKGYYGEKECSYYLSLLSEERFLIFHGLRLKDKKPFQMDLLILCRSFALIAEVKNYSGKLKFQKESNHVTKEYNQQEEGISNPIAQVKRHHMQFLNWLRKSNISIPVESIVIISKTSTKIETAQNNMQIFNDLIYAESLIDKLQKLESKYTTPHISKKKLKQLGELLLKEHLPYIPNILRYYNLSPEDIRNGVQCPLCHNFPMVYRSASWQCPRCLYISKTAHIKGVDDFFILISPTMTRKQFKVFLQIPKDSTAKNMLKTLNLPTTGSKRGTKYSLPNNCILSPPNENDMKKGDFFK
ncbi:nuclease-related domain-containing protein [Neobacillus mesonae]|uniref:nuclease-related domain-containing protein n=1 Tax=Neobacillus mesonae TaxID=1193713 RepID=UPI002E2346DB|nr:nuclease-related domain-containing protein [Neobacillus mesonae]